MMKWRQRSRYRDPVVAAACLTMAMAWACAGKKAQAPASADGGVAADTSAAATEAAAAGEDPCRYLTASDVEPYTGSLVSPPYRATDDAIPSRSGGNCLYRGKDGREVLLQYGAHGGHMAGTVARRVPAVMDRLLHNGAGGASQGVAGGADSQGGVASTVMGSVGPGPWDNSNWFPTGTLIVYKGDGAFDIDIAATSAGKDAAVDLATKAIARLPQPLDYDGARAVALAPKPVRRVPPCDLVPRDRAEQILGKLSANPRPDSAGTSCTYQVASADGDVSYQMGVNWTQGYKGVNMLKHGMSAIAGPLGMAGKTFNVGGRGMGTSVPSSMPDMPKLDPGQQKMFGAFTKALGMPGMGAAVSRGLKTDTTMAGPWDTAALVNGSWLLVSKDDVELTMILGTADYDKAKALFAAACERL